MNCQLHANINSSVSTTDETMAYVLQKNKEQTVL
jgi:hypothetical protein